MPQNEMVVGLAQRVPLHGPNALSDLRTDVERTLDRHPELDMLVFPELHLHGVDHLPSNQQTEALARLAMPLGDPSVAKIGEVAAEFGIWLCPGSIGETSDAGGQHNTQLLFSPDGTLAASYRKMFPWRPFEPHRPGTKFVVTPVADHGCVGLSNCYDAWFPEHSRHLAWLGADAIINVVKTTSQDRDQELVLARANAIVNQVYMLSVNCAEPVGRGHSIAVDPEGHVLAEATTGEETLVVRVDPGRIQRVRARGTAGTNRIWSQFTAGDDPIALPLYDGNIDPVRWTPRHCGHD